MELSFEITAHAASGGVILPADPARKGCGVNAHAGVRPAAWAWLSALAESSTRIVWDPLVNGGCYHADYNPCTIAQLMALQAMIDNPYYPHAVSVHPMSPDGRVPQPEAVGVLYPGYEESMRALVLDLEAAGHGPVLVRGLIHVGQGDRLTRAAVRASKRPTTSTCVST